MGISDKPAIEQVKELAGKIDVMKILEKVLGHNLGTLPESQRHSIVSQVAEPEAQ